MVAPKAVRQQPRESHSIPSEALVQQRAWSGVPPTDDLYINTRSEGEDGASDPITQLGGQSCIIAALVVIKLLAQCTGVDSSNDGEISNRSFFRLHEAFHYPFQKMMGQGMYVVFVIAICDIINIQALRSANLEQMIEVAFVAVIVWILMGAFLVYYAQSRMKKWYMLELYAHDSQQLDKLQRSYAKIYSKQKGVGQVQPKLMSIREELEYLILRLIFINPVGLPCMTESFLRKDFHFAMYLAYCYGKVLTKFFKWSLFSLVLLLVLVITLNLTFEAIQDPEARLYINFSFLFVVFIVLILLKSCLTHAEKKLTPNVFDEKTGLLRDPEAFNICFNERQAAVDPFLQYDELPRMSYLEFDARTTELSEVEREQLVNDEERQALLNQSVASARAGKNHYARSLAAQEEDGKRP